MGKQSVSNEAYEGRKEGRERGRQGGRREGRKGKDRELGREKRKILLGENLKFLVLSSIFLILLSVLIAQDNNVPIKTRETDPFPTPEQQGIKCTFSLSGWKTKGPDFLHLPIPIVQML
jgi:hypothetical protein